jgi:transposase
VRCHRTILVDLETRRVIDLLPDRTAETFAAWLRQHPEVEVISRDRGGAYAEGARLGAPQATQVADRFHLLRNVTEALERYLIREYACLRQAAQAPAPPLPTEPAAGDPVVPPSRRVPSRKEEERQARRGRKLARYEEVRALRAHGHSVRGIAARTHLDRRTVKRYLQAAGFPENGPRARRTTQISRFVPYLRDRWAAGCRNAKRLWHELRGQGFSGGYTTVTDLLRAWRERPVPRGGVRCQRGGAQQATTAGAAPTFSARQTVWLLRRPRETLTEEEQDYLLRLYQVCPHVALAQALVQEFAAVLGARDVEGLYAWLGGTGACPIRELSAVAQGMWLDRQAIEAAVVSDWSQGQTEGQVNRLNSVS